MGVLAMKWTAEWLAAAGCDPCRFDSKASRDQSLNALRGVARASGRGAEGPRRGRSRRRRYRLSSY